MALLGTAELNMMRAVFNNSLPDTAVIHSPAFVDDSGGGGTVTYSTAGTYACRLSPSGFRAAERETAERVGESSRWLISLPTTATVTMNDRAVIGSTTYEITAIETPRSWQIGHRVEAQKVV